MSLDKLNKGDLLVEAKKMASELEEIKANPELVEPKVNQENEELKARVLQLEKDLEDKNSDLEEAVKLNAKQEESLKAAKVKPTFNHGGKTYEVNSAARLKVGHELKLYKPQEIAESKDLQSKLIEMKSNVVTIKED